MQGIEILCLNLMVSGIRQDCKQIYTVSEMLAEPGDGSILKYRNCMHTKGQ